MKDGTIPPIYKEDIKDVHFPRAGADTSLAFSKQPNRPMDGKSDYARSSIKAVNMRGYDPVGRRDRGGSRTGLSKYLARQVADTEFVVQDVNTVVKFSEAPVQTSLSGRVVTLVAVSQGKVYYANAGETTWTEATNNTGETPPLNFSGILRSASNQQLLWFADGINWAYFKPSTGTVEVWAATAGSLPEDGDANTPRLICTWRGRTILSGIIGDPQNYFASRTDTPTDFDYAPLSPGPDDAWSGNNGPAGLVGDCVTAMIPYTDDVLIFGCDHSIWIMRGDPNNGGQLDMVSGAIGMAFGEAWTIDPMGNVYFFSNRMGIYQMVPGQQPQRISQAIDSSLLDIDTGTNGIRLLWDDRFQGFHTFVTPLAAPTTTTHYFYEARTGAWWMDEFANDNHNPLCCCTFDGNLPTDRVALVGGWDGYVRAVDPTATDDDGTAINSEVWIGPFLTPTLDEMILKDMQAVLADISEDVNFAVHLGKTAETAFNSTAVLSGKWKAGRNLNAFVRKAAHALYIRLTSSKPWAFEVLRLRLATTGIVRQRGQS